MPEKLLYREGTLEDLPQLKELGFVAYSSFADRLGPEKWPVMRDSLSNEATYSMLLEKAKTFVCTTGRRIIGMAYLMPKNNPTPVYPAEWAYIRFVGVHPDYRGRGIARKLTIQCLDHARTTGETTIGLHTSEMMDAARHIYESLGFKKLKEIDNPFGVVYWLYSMEL